MTEAPLPRRRRATFVWLALGGLTAAGLAAAFVPSLQASVAEGPSAVYCATAPAAAGVAAADRRDERYAVTVPVRDPSMGPPAIEARPVAQGDVVQFDVRSSLPGTLAVHGLTELRQAEVGGVTTVAFRAIYSGRFPLHFHGVDGSHVEIAALEVMPAAKVAAGPGIVQRR